MKFGENLKKIRKDKKMSQEQLAERVNVSRQSVSKWENGEAYPEMNNILQLCKIFGCKINDLVHADMCDISSLGEEIIMKVVKFNEKKQKHVKSLSNVVSLIGKIGSIVLKVAIPFVLLAMALFPYIVSNVKIDNDNVTFKTENIKIIDDDRLELFGIILVDLEDDVSSDAIVDMFNTHSKYELIAYLEIAMLVLMVDLIIMITILDYVNKLFDNIKNNNTPFILENVNYIKRISYLMIALILISPLTGTLFGYLFNVSGSESEFNLMSVLEILIIFSMSYVFEYGYEIQKDSKGIMYNE